MANFNYCAVQLGCRLSSDPVLRTTPNGVNVVSFSVAVNRRVGQGQVSDFYNVVAWRNTADFVSKYFKKGMSCFITGSIINKNWSDQHGIKHFGFEIVADQVHFVDSKSSGSANVDPGTGELVELDPNEPLPFDSQ